jgi:hypothetical protein
VRISAFRVTVIVLSFSMIKIFFVISIVIMIIRVFFPKVAVGILGFNSLK